MFDSNKKIVYQDTLDEYHKRISALIGTGGSQISTIPTASEDYENVIYQYIGDTDSTYTNGYFYKCIEDPNNTGEYIWVNEQVQDGGSSSGGGHEIEDSSGTSLTQRDTLQFAGDFEVDDDSTNEATVVTPHELTNAEIEEILTEIPGPPVSILRLGNKFDRGDMYSTEERMIGQWIDGKPLYQKTFEFTTPASTSDAVAITLDSTFRVKDFSVIIDGRMKIPFAYPLTSSTAISTCYVATNYTDFRIRVRTDDVNLPAVATFQYTKTTDSAVSIGEDTEYSTTEKIVGSWIDGSPLYQRTWTGLNVATSNNWIDIFNISDVVVRGGFCFIDNDTNVVYPMMRVLNGKLQGYSSGWSGSAVTTVVLQYTKSNS